MNKMMKILAVPAVSAAILLGGAGMAAAATVEPTYSEGATNIDLHITNNTGAPMTLSWSGLTGSLDHWDTRPLAVLGAGDSEDITGYSHNLFTELDMAVNYTTASGDLATFDVQANRGDNANPNIDNFTDGTGVVQGNGQPATDLSITPTINQPTGGWVHAVADMPIGPAAS